MTQHEVPSFSIGLCDRAISALGGEHTETALGRAVIAVRAEAAAKQNLTALWLARHGIQVRSMLVSYLETKLATSRNMGLIEDHVQTFLLRLVERDTLRPHLQDGKEPTPSVLRIWLYQSACTEMRGWGVDASLRKSRGAKTNRDRLVEKGKKPEAPVIHASPVAELRSFSESEEIGSDYYDPESRTVEDRLADLQLVEAYRSRIEKRLKDARFLRVFESLLDGDKRRELAEAHGMTPAQVSAMISRIREVVVEANA